MASYCASAGDVSVHEGGLVCAWMVIYHCLRACLCRASTGGQLRIDVLSRQPFQNKMGMPWCQVLHGLDDMDKMGIPVWTAPRQR